MSGDFSIGPWRVQPAVNRISRGDEVIRLEPKVMQVLVCLAEQAGEVVSRETLIARVWPDVFVTDDVLHRAVRELRRVFGDSSAEPRVIETIRKRGYRLMVVAEDETSPVVDLPAPPALPAAPAVAPRSSWSGPALATALVVASAAISLGLLVRDDAVTEAHPRFAALVSGPSNESDPAVAPDGQRLAYVVRDGANDQADIYVQSRPGAAAERLTIDPADDRMPVWSADGRRLAFVRMAGSQCDIIVRALDAATEQLVGPCPNPSEPRMAWTPDGQSLIVSEASGETHVSWRLARLSLASGERTGLTLPPADAVGDHSPAVSPDGRSVAFIRDASGATDVHVVPIGGGQARRITFDEADLTGVDWTARGRALVFASDRAGGYSLWRVGAEGGEPQLVAGGAARLKHPVAARDLDRVVYESWQYEIDIWRVGLRGGQVGQVGRPVIETSELWNLYPQVSPDGTRVAYVSTQSGSHELWLAAADGSGRRQLTEFGRENLAQSRGTSVRAPRWSPDGQRLVFAAHRGGRVDVYILAVDSGALTAMTSDQAVEVAPSWSADGRRVYYSVRDGDRSNVWARDSAGANAPVMAVPGAVAVQSGPDAALYFTRGDSRGVWRLASEGAEPLLVTDRVGVADTLSWVVAAGGVFFVASEGREIVLHRAPLAGGATERMATLTNYSWPGFSITPDGASVLYARWDRRESNIMAVEPTAR
jgi:Tol biopolymer transport system component/DNA-binding winged helix-turn-helix (wHTH) protein